MSIRFVIFMWSGKILYENVSDDLSRSQVELTLPTTFTFLEFFFFSLFCQRKSRVELFFFTPLAIP